MVIIKPHSETHHVQTIHPTDLGLLPSWKSIVCAPAQRFPTFWDARKRVQERFPVSCYSRKSELVKLQCNPNDYILIEAIRFKVEQRMEGARKDRHGTKKILGQCTNDKVATEFALFYNQTG